MRKQRENHGLTKHPLYRKWQDMMDRCYNQTSQKYPWYGAVGVTVCPEWKNSPKAFIEWCLEAGWVLGKEIDKDLVNPNTKIYSPATCSIVSHRENMLAVVGRSSGNKTQKLKLSVEDVISIRARKLTGITTRQLAQEYGVHVCTINRILRN